MSTYQSYDFLKDINFHFSKHLPLDLSTKSEIFKIYLFKLKIFQLHERIKEDHPLFKEEYLIFTNYNKVFIAKKMLNTNSSILNHKDEPIPQFDYLEILNGVRAIRKMKLKKLFK